MDVRDFVGLDDNVIFGGVMEDPVKAMKLEWRAASRDPTVGSEADWENFVYVTEGRAQTDMVPAHVLQSFESGHYHGGSITKEEFDQGHEGMGLDDFLELESSKTAKLKKEHMIAIRLYTSSSYHLFNKPMRDRMNPHPIKVSVYILTQGLKKLRQVLAAKDPKEYAKKKQLWRGMKNMALDIRKFSEEGGAELAPMSTTEDPAVAEKYVHTHADIDAHACMHACMHTHMHPFIYVDLLGLRVEGLHMLALHAGTLKAVTVSFSSTRQKETPGAWRYVLSRARVARVLSFMALWQWVMLCK